MKAWLVLLLFGASLAGFQQSKILLPDETAGLDGIVQTLVFAFDHFDIVALGENHWNKMDSDLRIALTLDRYIRGEDVPLAELQQVWKTTTQTDGIWDSPVYADFYAAVRDVNKRLPARSLNNLNVL